MEDLKNKEELLKEVHSFYEKEVKPTLPAYNSKRKRDRVIIYSAIGAFVSLGLCPIHLAFALVAALLVAIAYLYQKNETVEFDCSYEMCIKKKLMPKFLNLFGKYHWAKNHIYNSEEIYKKLTSLKILPKTSMMAFDDVIYGIHKDVKVEVIELRTGIYASGLIGGIMLIIGASIIVLPILGIGIGFLVLIAALIPNTHVQLGFIAFVVLVLLALIIGVIALFIRNAFTNQSIKGVVLKYTFPKKFNKHTFIFENKLSSQKLIHKGRQGYEKVSLEDSEFDKNYTVFSDDQVEARYLLTTSFIERFKNIETAFNPLYQRAEFKENEFYILLGTNRDLFKMGSLGEETNYSQFSQLFEEFYSVLDLIEHFKLNQHIGL